MCTIDLASHSKSERRGGVREGVVGVASGLRDRRARDDALRHLVARVVRVRDHHMETVSGLQLNREEQRRDIGTVGRARVARQQGEGRLEAGS